MIKLKYKDCGNFEFATLIQKLANAQTTVGVAVRIKSIVRELTKGRELISKSYQDDLVSVFGEKNEDGTIKRPEGEPNGFTPVKEKEEEFIKAQEDFGERELDLDCHPLNPTLLADMKCSSKELDLLKGLFTDEAGPGVPSNVAQMRR